MIDSRKAILEFEAPESCSECMLRYQKHCRGPYGDYFIHKCVVTKERIEECVHERHSSCPLKITYPANGGDSA